MEITQPGPVALMQSTVQSILTHPFISVLAILLLTCITTRIVSGIRYSSAISQLRQPSANPKTVPVLPYWIPWLGHGVSFALGSTTFLTRKARSLGPNGSIYALFMANSKHNVVTSPSLSRQILVDRRTPITMEPFIYHIMGTFWDDKGTIKAVEHDALFNVIHGVLNGMLRESFVSTAIQGTVQRVEERTWNLISGLESPVDQSTWERVANVEIISNKDNDGSFVAEASLFPLLRYFIGNIATDVLMGRNFIENHPNIMQDLFEMDSQFNLFLAGTPSWFPGMAGPSLARERVIDAVLDHHEAYFKYVDGEDPGPRWNDISDTSSVIADRAIEFRKANTAPRGWATGNGAILWAMNVNANPVIFWMVWYIYSDPTLLEELRREVVPYVQLVRPAATGLPIQEAPRLKIDMAALWTRCPLLKGAFFETMRLEAASMSYKVVEEDFVVTESEQDARLLGKKEPQSFLLHKGELICIPHGVHQSDERYFRDPDRFDPRRFWVKEDAEKDTNSNDDDVRVDYGTMKVWGGGKQMCKGKTFAEREVVLFAAAIIMQWDVVPLSDGGKWVHPGRKVGAGANNPVKDVRVRMSRREAW